MTVTYTFYDFILQDHEASEERAIDCARGMDWQAMETHESAKPTHSRFVDSVNGIDIYYDFAADYYFFADSE